MTQAARYIPIVPRAGLYLIGYGYGDDDRFARLFLSTWRRLPLWARRRMLKFWREDTSIVKSIGSAIAPRFAHLTEWNAETPRIPGIYLMPFWEGRRRGDMAVVQYDGWRMTFLSRLIDRMPDEIVCNLVAHELSHVYQHAEGIERRFGVPDPGNYTLETDADEIQLHCFGFDGEEIDRWLESQGLTKTIEVHTFEELVTAHLDSNRWKERNRDDEDMYDGVDGPDDFQFDD